MFETDDGSNVLSLETEDTREVRAGDVEPKQKLMQVRLTMKLWNHLERVKKSVGLATVAETVRLLVREHMVAWDKKTKGKEGKEKGG